MIVDPQPFDVCGPLPTGVTVLEASAGTGKTFTIAALAARYVADAVPLERLLLVTFTRMATGELRERVRERLVSAEQGLSRVLAGGPQAGGDRVLALLADGDEPTLHARRERLARAVADFDAATIATTHGFCQEVLHGLGVAGDHEADATLVEDLSDLVTEVVDDLYVRRFHWAPGIAFDRSQALAIGHAVVANPSTRLEPAAAPPHTTAAMRLRLACAVRTEVELRKRRLGILGYDDLLARLNSALDGEAGGEIGARLRDRYAVVRVDEFQDTDPDQWRILQRAFGAGETTLVLIGDPKQAIYAFRGADVYAYLDAARRAGTQRTLDVNWRSDQRLIDAHDALLGGARLGHEQIVYRRVRAADAHRTARLRGAPVDAPLRVRIVDRGCADIELTPRGFAAAPSARAHVAGDVADDVVRLLSAPAATIDLRDGDGGSLGSERLRPRHVAVLVHAHNRATLVRDALRERGVPAVINGAGSVFATPAARDWLVLLEAIERPESPPRAHAAALTPFVAWDAARVATAPDDEREELHRRLHAWARVLRERGVAALAEAIVRGEDLPARMLAVTDGERRLTDLRHVAQLLHAAATSEGLGAAALTAWLRQRVARAEQETEDVERTRRLESDDEAVQVLTVHRSKGLEFPIVYCPYLWEPGWIPKDPAPVFFHDPAHADARTLDVGLDGGDFARHVALHRGEERGEDLRLLYVALTRARHQTVVWWAGSYDSRESPLGRLLFARAEDGTVALQAPRPPSDDGAEARLRELAGVAPEGCIAVERTGDGTPARWSPPRREGGSLSARALGRGLDQRWRRTSFSDIVAATHEARVDSEPEVAVLSDEPDEPGASAIPPPGAADGARSGEPSGAPPAPAAVVAAESDEEAVLRSVPSLLGELPVGRRVGTLVHEVLEATDFAAAELDAELTARVAAARARRTIDVGDSERLVAGLRAMLETPLGPALRGARLRDIARADRLDELQFELPLAGGDDPTGRLELQAIAALLGEHLPAGDPLAAYAPRLADPGLRASVRGYLTGSLDLVVRVPGTGAHPAFAVVDYKTNWLGVAGEPLTAWNHRPQALAAEMGARHYGLQALLYTVALHRYLRWRLPGYDAERHLAGVLYLFVRGMTGADTPVVDGRPCGVFAWRPPGALVEELSDLFDRGAGS
ncbi:MAG TPA: UvrD-helicase domain-containing protein [Solirubrobacteraceae bacterium]|nr:UvrD-helicase domain-containing protein [Solirubrobacteraceae bacterium]